MSFAGAMVLAMLIDRAIGWPDALFFRIGHPVTWLGRLINALDRRLNKRQRWQGVLALGIVLVVVLGLSLLVQSLLPDTWVGTLALAVLAWPLVAIKSMQDHVLAVIRPLAAGDLPGARFAVSMIVGRNPDTLDEAGIARAATESLAENTSDGIVAPLFWGVVAGLPGIAGYKAINTLDSMVGHKNDRFLQFGWASARLDDWVNLIPARLTGVLFALASGHPRRAFACMQRDARKHRSPNAGWPEAAMAGALGARLSGPRVYDGKPSAEPWVNEGAPDPTPGDMLRGLRIYRLALALLALPVLMLFAGGW
ncbi:MAG: adenosylcobinamide-phosphate synthase CbiB [Paracoccaceae bacterium]